MFTPFCLFFVLFVRINAMVLISVDLFDVLFESTEFWLDWTEAFTILFNTVIRLSLVCVLSKPVLF